MKIVTYSEYLRDNVKFNRQHVALASQIEIMQTMMTINDVEFTAYMYHYPDGSIWTEVITTCIRTVSFDNMTISMPVYIVYYCESVNELKMFEHLIDIEDMIEER